MEKDFGGDGKGGFSAYLCDYFYSIKINFGKVQKIVLVGLIFS